jgi:tetratricopeptide (TPR) repeat protein
MTHHTHNPNHTLRSLYPVLAGLAALLVGVSVRAQEDTPKEQPAIRWRATDTAGNAVSVPSAGKISVVLFVMTDQVRSDEAMAQLRALLADEARGAGVQPVAVVSGHGAGVGAAQLAGSDKWPWPVVVDVDYEASGLMSVRVWPTTVIVDGAGKRIAHMPGLRESYTKDMRAYLDFVHGTIDESVLERRLDTNGTVASTPSRVASRHLHLAEKLLEKGQVGLARKELVRGLAGAPDDVPLQLTLARVHLMIGEPGEALAVLDALDTDAAPAWRLGTLRGRALVALKRFDEARGALADALRINPDPAEAYYFLGRVHEHFGEWEQAADAYRNAFEKSTAAKGLGRSETAEAP